eukprot:3528522-Pyramimonas_sp.AAC.1
MPRWWAQSARYHGIHRATHGIRRAARETTGVRRAPRGTHWTALRTRRAARGTRRVTHPLRAS